MVFVEPETPIGRALLLRFGVQAITPLEPETTEAMMMPASSRPMRTARGVRFPAEGRRQFHREGSSGHEELID
jgi:hypothetical protein